MNASTEWDEGAKAPSPSGHSRFGASGAHRWTVCHGSIKAQEGLADDDSPFAIEGTACHTVAGLCLENSQDAIEYVGRTIQVEKSDGTATGVEIDEEEHTEGIQLYLDTIRADQAAHGGTLLIEHKFHLADLHPDFWGTCDCALVPAAPDGVLRVYDLKMGRGKIVEVLEIEDGQRRVNKQLGYYAIGALAGDGRLLRQTGTDEKVELVVIQPRAGHSAGPVRRAVVTIAELRELGRDLVASAAKCLEPNPVLVAGDHCTFCKAAATCPALRKFAVDTAQLDFDDDTGVATDAYGNIKIMSPLDITPDRMAKILDAVDVIDNWIKATRMHAMVLANGGHAPTGWKLVDRKARRKWEDEEKAANELCFVYGLDESSIYAKKLKSPAQVDKLLPTKSERDLLHKSNLYSAKSSGTTLVRDSDKRSEVQPALQADFDDGQSDAIDW